MKELKRKKVNTAIYSWIYMNGNVHYRLFEKIILKIVNKNEQHSTVDIYLGSNLKNREPL